MFEAFRKEKSVSSVYDKAAMSQLFWICRNLTEQVIKVDLHPLEGRQKCSDLGNIILINSTLYELSLFGKYILMKRTQILFRYIFQSKILYRLLSILSQDKFLLASTCIAFALVCAVTGSHRDVHQSCPDFLRLDKSLLHQQEILKLKC